MTHRNRSARERFHRPHLALIVALAIAACSDEPISGEPIEPFAEWTLDELSEDEGFSFRTPVFDVPSGEEIQDCYFFAVPDLNDGEDFWVDRIVTAINPGSHHMNVFRVRTIHELGGNDGDVVRGGPCFASANWADWPLVANSQNSSPRDPTTDWTLPSGVAHRFRPGELLMVQTHYVNVTTQTTPYRGRVGVNFHLSRDPEPQELGTVFATQQSIRVCRSRPNPQVYSGTCRFPTGEITIEAANGHFHSRGQRFTIATWDGLSDEPPPTSDEFYESTEWDEPPMAQELGIAVEPGGGIWWTCSFAWVPPPVGCDVLDAKDREGEGDCCYTFGPEVDPNEHCNVFLYYWPKVGDADVFCN